MLRLDRPTINSPSTAERVIELKKYLDRLAEDLQRESEEIEKRLKELEERNG